MMKCPLTYQSNARDGQIYTELSPLLLRNLVIQSFQMDSSIPINVTLTIESSNVVSMFHRGPCALSMDSTDIIAYQCSSLVNDRKNNRENCKNLPQKINSLTPKSVLAGTKNSRSEGFWLAKLQIPTLVQLCPPPTAWVWWIRPIQRKGDPSEVLAEAPVEGFSIIW